MMDEDPAIAEQASKAQSRMPGSTRVLRPDCTDVGNAMRLVRRHGDALRYCHPWKCWLVWEGPRWKRDNCGEAVRFAKDTARAIYGEAAIVKGVDEFAEDRRKRVANFAARSSAGWMNFSSRS